MGEPMMMPEITRSNGEIRWNRELRAYFVHRWAEGATTPELQVEFGASAEAIRKMRARLKLPARGNGVHISNADRDEDFEAWVGGKMMRDIGAARGLTENAIYHRLRLHPGYKAEAERRRILKIVHRPGCPWPHRDDELRTLWPNHTTLQIGAKMGLTRGQIIGRGHRLRLVSKGPVLRTADEMAATERARYDRENQARRMKRLGLTAPEMKPSRPTRAAPPLHIIPPPIPQEPRGTPGVALPPVGRPWRAIVDTALRDGRLLASKDDLPGYNRARIARGYAPLAVWG